ncbi:MAG TPA: hypothetical protein VFT67_12405 [Jatrophihabitantaceae bacterium]|jgi:hypothetical protein|nr:hypothetical protein [Jatrophihabitantaceae bacterium]
MMSRPAPKHAPRVPFALLMVALVVGGLATLLVLNTASAANELKRHDLTAKDADVAAKVEQLRNEVAASQAPGNLARVAAQLGMVPAGNPAFLQIAADGKVRVLGSPAPASAPPVAPPSSAHPHTSAAHPHGTASKSASESPNKSARSASTSASRSASKPASSSSAPKPPTSSTPAPDPTTMLPGGTR